jgi:hypothetical protein
MEWFNFSLAPYRNMIRIPYPDFVREHVRLIGVLESGNKSKLLREAKEQRMELIDVQKRQKTKK